MSTAVTFAALTGRRAPQRAQPRRHRPPGCWRSGGAWAASDSRPGRPVAGDRFERAASFGTGW